jgi:SH3 domain protein
MEKVMTINSLARTRIFTLSSCFLLLLCATSVLAQTWYIKPTAEIPLRRGQGTDYKILAIVSDGLAVNIVEEDETWAKITTENGEEGWILKRYLTRDTPLDKVVTALRTENNALKEKVNSVEQQNTELQRLKTALEETLANNKSELASTTEKYRSLVEDNENVITMKNELSESRQTVTSLQQKIGAIVAENERLKASQTIKWFLAGGGTLVFGCVVGLLSAKASKKRKSSLY